MIVGYLICVRLQTEINTLSSVDSVNISENYNTQPPETERTSRLSQNESVL